MELYDLIQKFEIFLYFSTVLLKYLTVIIGLFTVLVMIVRCTRFVLQPNNLFCAMCEWLVEVWKNNPNQLRTFVENNVL